MEFLPQTFLRAKRPQRRRARRNGCFRRLVGSHLEKRERTQLMHLSTFAVAAIAVKSGFHMIAAIAELFFSDRSDRSDHMETRLKTL